MLAAGSTFEVQVAGRAGVPDDADVVSLNVTAVGPQSRGYLSLLSAEFGCDLGGEPPTTSTVNFDSTARAFANATAIQLSSKGTVCVYAHEPVHALLDVSTYGTDDDPRVVRPKGAIGPYLPPSN